MRFLIIILTLLSFKAFCQDKVIFSKSSDGFCLARSNKLFCIGGDINLFRGGYFFSDNFENIQQVTKTKGIICINDNSRLNCLFEPRKDPRDFYSYEDGIFQEPIKNIVFDRRGKLYVEFEKMGRYAFNLRDQNGVTSFNGLTKREINFWPLANIENGVCYEWVFDKWIICDLPGNTRNRIYSLNFFDREKLFYNYDNALCSWMDSYSGSKVFITCLYSKRLFYLYFSEVFDTDYDFETANIYKKVYSIKDVKNVDDVQAGSKIFCAFSSKNKKAYCRPNHNSYSPTENPSKLSLILNKLEGLEHLYLSENYNCYVQKGHLTCLNERAEIIKSIDELNIYEYIMDK